MVCEGDTLCYLMFPVGRLKQLAKDYGRCHERGGDGGRFSNILIPLVDILK